MLSPETEPPPAPPQPPPLPETARPYPGFWQAIGLLAIHTLGTIIVIVPVAVGDSVSKTAHMKSPWVLGLATLAGAALVLLVAPRKLGLGWREIAGKFRIPSEIIGPMASMITGQLIVTMAVLLWLLRLFPGWMPTETYGLDKSLIGAAFALMIAAPLSEEFLFRGVFLRGFVPRYGMRNGILLGAAIFAAAHFSAVKIFGTFMLGVIFGWWYSKLGSIWPGVIGHALNNGVPVLVAALVGKQAVKDNALPKFSWAEPLIGIIGLALLVHGVLKMRGFFERERNSFVDTGAAEIDAKRGEA